MTTIQDRIIKDFRKQFNQCFNIGVVPDDITKEKLEQFLRDSIKLVQEETRKEIFDNLPKVIEPPEDIEKFKEKRQAFLAGQMNMLMRLNDLSLSITNKESK